MSQMTLEQSVPVSPHKRQNPADVRIRILGEVGLIHAGFRYRKPDGHRVGIHSVRAIECIDPRAYWGSRDICRSVEVTLGAPVP
jgi:hypothetical protein